MRSIFSQPPPGKDCLDFYHDIQCMGSNCHRQHEGCRRWWPKYEPRMELVLNDEGKLECTGRLEKQS